MQILKTLFFLAVLAINVFALPLKSEFETKGVVLLDSITFRKIIPNDNFDVVVLLCNKRQIGDYGTDSIRSDYFHFAYKSNTENGADRVLFAQVIVNGAENLALAEEMGAPRDFMHPLMYVIPAGRKQPVQYPSTKPFHARELSNFVAKHSSLHFQLPGQITVFDDISDEFMELHGDRHREARAALVKKAKQELEKLRAPDGAEEGEAAQYYISVMEKVLNQGNNYIKKEIMRLTKLLGKDSVSSAKKRNLERHLNILHHFEAHADESTFDEKTSGDAEKEL